jgi:hypothetical protein
VIRVSMGHYMDVEKNIADIAFLEELYALPDMRPIATSAEKPASLVPDELNSRDLWLSLGLTLRNHLQRLWTVWHSKER